MDLKSAAQILSRRIGYVSKQVEDKKDSKKGLWHAQNEILASQKISNIVNVFLEWEGEETKTINIDGMEFEIKPKQIKNFGEAFEKMKIRIEE